MAGSYLVCALFFPLQSNADVGADCISCHAGNNPGIHKQWKFSKHGQNDIGCTDCYEAEKGDPDGFEHHGANIVTLVTPNDCGKCHKYQVEQTTNSYHAQPVKF